LTHNFIEPVSANGFDSLRLVEVIHWDAFVLKREKEEEHLVDFLFLPMFPLLGLS
jgi:hypothetical protein